MTMLHVNNRQFVLACIYSLDHKFVKYIVSKQASLNETYVLYAICMYMYIAIM